MLDISRDRVPTMAHLDSLVETLAALKFNHLQLYTEHTFAYHGHEDVWRDASPIMPEELQRLDARCAEAGIILAANQNCFGHLSRWLRHPAYAPLAEIPDAHGQWTFEYAGERFSRTGPFSLCPTDPRSLEFVRDLLRQMLPCVRSGLVNIGCDETFDVGAGRSRVAVRQRGRAGVCCEFIGRVGEIARDHGARAMFWADMVLADPAAAARHIPRDMIALIWNYEPGYDFSGAIERVSGRGGDAREAWVCPGTSAWRSITGRTHERAANLQEAARQGLAAGARGYLVTEWGDVGHHQQWPITLTAIAHAADAAWTGGRDAYDPRAASLHVFDDRSVAVAPFIHALGHVDAGIRSIAGRRGPGETPRPMKNATALFNDLHLPLGAGGDPRVRHGLMSVPLAMWESVGQRLDALARDVPQVGDAIMRDELVHALRIARAAAARAIARRTSLATVGNLIDEFAAITDEYARLWHARSRPGGLRDSLAHYHAITRDLREAMP